MSSIWSEININAAVLSEGIAAFIALVYWRKLSYKYLYVFPIILVLIFLVEFGAGMLISSDWRPLIYNLLSIITFCGYSYIFFRHIPDNKYKEIVKICTIAYLISVVANCFCVSILHDSHQISYIVGGLNMIIFPVIYFLSILNNSKTLTIKQDLMFWISIGLLLFYVGYLPIKLSRFYFSIAANPFFYSL